MADNSILTPGYQDSTNVPVIDQDSEKYLSIDNFLSEYSTEEQKSVARENLGVPSKNSTYNKQDVDIMVSAGIRDAIQEYLNLEDPHGILPAVEEKIIDMVKINGSTPFIAPQSGVDPTLDNHLTTKRFVNRLLREHINTEDPHNILPEVKLLLEKYTKTSDTYYKSQLYTRQDLDKQASEYIRKNGTTPFTKAQIGVDPQIDSHLSTKRYVDKSIYSHIVDVDPHGFISILNNRLASYSKKKEVFDKTETYSRTQIDSIINKIVEDSVDASIKEYVELINDKLEYIRLQNYVKQDGSVPFRNPQSSVDATQDDHLVTLRQLKQESKNTISQLTDKIEDKECLWITSGPVQSTVGHLEDNTPVPDTMTLQEVCDAIFYGKGISLEVPDYVTIAESCQVTMCIHGSSGLVEYAELYQNEQVIYTFERDAFESGCVTVDSSPIFQDAVFLFKVTYTNGSVHEEAARVKCHFPVFVGLLPKWKYANTITMDYLIELSKEDIDGTQNRFLNYGDDLKQISFKYQFEDSKLRHPFLVIPESYPDLESMATKSQSFGIDAFDIIDMIPLEVPGIQDEIIFKIYVYRQALSSLDQEVTFNFVAQ